MYKFLRKKFVYRWRRPKELPLIYKKRRSNPMIGTPLFLNNLNYTHTIENVNKIICTFLKTLNRMNDLVEGCKITGQVTLDGTDIYRDLDVNLLRKRVGMVFQKPNPFPMSVYDNIAYGPRTHGIHS